jgi:hypothetical protein
VLLQPHGFVRFDFFVCFFVFQVDQDTVVNLPLLLEVLRLLDKNMQHRSPTTTTTTTTTTNNNNNNSYGGTQSKSGPIKSGKTTRSGIQRGAGSGFGSEYGSGSGCGYVLGQMHHDDAPEVMRDRRWEVSFAVYPFAVYPRLVRALVKTKP